jgi:predicted metal-dependent phosphoesterase TrpH
MGYSDLHIHSIHSYDGTSSVPAILKYVADHTDLNVIAITDHDTIAGVREALYLAPRYGIEVIPGCEVSTAEGHLIALFIKEVIPAGLSLVETVQRVAAQGGLCVVPHPEAKGTSSVTGETLRAVYRDPQIRKTLIGVETFNGGLVYTRSTLPAERIVEGL